MYWLSDGYYTDFKNKSILRSRMGALLVHLENYRMSDADDPKHPKKRIIRSNFMQLLQRRLTNCCSLFQPREQRFNIWNSTGELMNIPRTCIGTKLRLQQGKIWPYDLTKTIRVPHLKISSFVSTRLNGPKLYDQRVAWKNPVHF